MGPALRLEYGVPGGLLLRGAVLVVAVAGLAGLAR